MGWASSEQHGRADAVVPVASFSRRYCWAASPPRSCGLASSGKLAVVLHPLAVVELVGALVNALQLIPIGSGSMAAASAWRSSASLPPTRLRDLQHSSSASPCARLLTSHSSPASSSSSALAGASARMDPERR